MFHVCLSSRNQSVCLLCVGFVAGKMVWKLFSVSPFFPKKYLKSKEFQIFRLNGTKAHSKLFFTFLKMLLVVRFIFKKDEINLI